MKTNTKRVRDVVAKDIALAAAAASSPEALRRAVSAAKNLGAPGTGMEFLRALDAAFPPPPPSPDHTKCPKCGHETHRSNVAKFGSCFRCAKGR